MMKHTLASEVYKGETIKYTQNIISGNKEVLASWSNKAIGKIIGEKGKDKATASAKIKKIIDKYKG